MVYYDMSRPFTIVQHYTLRAPVLRNGVGCTSCRVVLSEDRVADGG